MRIVIVQSGGVAGLRRERVVETEQLGDAGRDEVERLVQSAEFFALPARRLSGLPDVIQYRVRVEDAGQTHEATFDDQTASEPLRELVARAFGEGGA